MTIITTNAVDAGVVIFLWFLDSTVYFYYNNQYLQNTYYILLS